MSEQRYMVRVHVEHGTEQVPAGDWYVAFSDNTAHRGPTLHPVTHAPAALVMNTNQVLKCAEDAMRLWGASGVHIETINHQPNA